MGNSGFGGGQGTGANGNSGTNNTGNQGAGGGANGDGSGDDAPQYVLKADFDTLVSKLDDVLKDNKRYRDERRQHRNQNQGGNDNGAGDDSRNGTNGNDGSNEMATLRKQLRQANFRTDITTAAIRAGATIPEDIHRLISIDDSDIDVDDLGYVKNADAVVAELKKSRPQYFGATVNGGADGGSGNTNRQRRANSFNDQLRSEMRAKAGRG